MQARCALSSGAIEVLQHTAMNRMFELFRESQRAALNAKRITAMRKDVKLATRMLHETGRFLAP